jgi:SAM-dependent methyltransferase
MNSNRLLRHYTSKYSGEGNKTDIPIIPRTGFPTNRYEAAIHFLSERFKGGAILELGAGNGIILRSLIEARLPFEKYVASDVSDPRLEGIRRSIHDRRIETAQIDAEASPEEHFERYDAILMVALIEHLIDPLGAMNSLRQMLRPGGFVYIDTPNIAKYSRRLKLLAGRFPSTASTNEGLTTYHGNAVDLFDEGHLHYFTYRSLSLMLTRRCGFLRVEKLGYFHGRQYLGRRMCRTMAQLWPEFFSDVVLIAYT